MYLSPGLNSGGEIADLTREIVIPYLHVRDHQHPLVGEHASARDEVQRHHTVHDLLLSEEDRALLLAVPEGVVCGRGGGGVGGGRLLASISREGATTKLRFSGTLSLKFKIALGLKPYLTASFLSFLVVLLDDRRDFAPAAP